MLTITENRYASTMPVLALDFISATELSQIRDAFSWASQCSRISTKGSAALCLASADDKYSVQYLAKLINKLRQAVRIEDLSIEVLSHKCLSASGDFRVAC